MNTNHGIVKVTGTHFEYEDGTPFYPLGTTVYALLHQKESLWEMTMQSLEASPFNKVRFCLFPKHYEWNTNKPPFFPFQHKDGRWAIENPVPEFWERMNVTLRRLEQAGLQANLILFHPYDRWGFSHLTVEDALSYLKCTVKTLGNHSNLWWSMANEYDLMDYTQENWETFASCIHENDPAGHLLSNHNAIHFWDFSNPYTTHICVQTGDIAYASTLTARFGKPVIIDETGYEGNLENDWGNLSAEEMTEKFWTAASHGAYCTHGETILQGVEEEILWWSWGGTLRGESWKRIGFLRHILESLPGPLSFQNNSYVNFSLEEIQRIAATPPDQRPAAFGSGSYLKGLLIATPEEIRRLQESLTPHSATYEDRVFLFYLGRRRPSYFSPNLPADKSYQVQIIDTWNMILETVPYTDHIQLPGKPYIAVLIQAQGI